MILAIRNGLHPDLLSDCQSKAIQDGEILYVSDVHGFISNMLSDLQQLDDIVKELNDNHGYGDIDFDEVLSDYLSKDVLSADFEGDNYNNSKSVPFMYEYPTVSHISEPSMSFETVCKLTHELNVVTCMVEITVSLDVYIPKSNLAIYGSAKGLQVIDPDWNEHYVYGTDTAYMALFFNIIVDKDFNEVINTDTAWKCVNYLSGFYFSEERID